MSRFILPLFLMLFLSACGSYQQPNYQLTADGLKSLHANYAPVKDGRIEYYRLGVGSPIILLPGYVTDISSWNRSFLAALAKHHELIILNNRNVGGSVVHSTQYEAKYLAEDTYQLIQYLELKKPTILGISMGGMLAQQLAVLHSDQIGPVILINTAIAGKQAIHPKADIEKKMLTMPTDQLGRYAVAVELFFPASWKIPMAYALAADRFQPPHYQAIQPETIAPQQRQLVQHWVQDDTTGEKIKYLTMPVLILNGEADAVIPPANSLILARTIPHAQLVRWKTGGHAMIYQYPDEMATAINRFINSQASLN